MKSYLTKLIARKKAEMKTLQERSDASQDINEVRSVGEMLTKLRDEITEAEEQLASIEEEGAGEGQRAAVPADAQLRNGAVVGSFQVAEPQTRSEDPTDSLEYRTAFMNYVCRGTAIPAELRAATATSDASVVIPTSIVGEIIQKMKTFGNVYAKVRKLNIQGGVSIPILSLKPTASWIGETAPSEDQKIQAKFSVVFNYFGVECKIAQTLLANVTTLKMFQDLFVPLAVEAITRAVEIAIFQGSGTNQPLGVVNETRIPAENIIEISPEDVKTWTGWHTAVKAKMKKAYRNGEFYMAQGTFDGYIDGMTDDNGQPIGRVNYGMDGEESYRFMGKVVETVEDECLPSYEDAEVGDVFAVFMIPTDYAINSNMEMRTEKWVDHDTNEVKNKCILICDGKVADPNGILLIKKGATTV